MGSNFEIKWDKNALDKVMTEAGKNSAAEMQKFFDSFGRTHKGKPVEDVKRSFRQQWHSKFGGDITDPELTEYATILSEGGKIQVRLG